MYHIYQAPAWTLAVGAGLERSGDDGAWASFATHACLMVRLAALVGVDLFSRLCLTFLEILTASWEVLMDCYWFPAPFPNGARETWWIANLGVEMCFGHEPCWIQAWLLPPFTTTPRCTQQIINELKEVQATQHRETRPQLVGSLSKIYSFLHAAIMALKCSQIKRWIELKCLGT